MGRLLGLFIDEPDHLACQVHRVTGGLPLGEGREPLGLGSYTDDAVLLARRPAGEHDLASLVRSLRTTALIAATSGAQPYDEDSTDPFRQRRWMFAMDGAVERFDEIKPKLLAELPRHVARQIVSPSDREHVFALFLAELVAHKRLDDPDVLAADAARSLASAVRKLDKLLRDRGDTRVTPLALLASNGRLLLGLRRGRPLHYGLLEGLRTCALCEVDTSTPESDPRVASHRRAKAVAVASAPRQTAGFLDVPDGSTVAVGRALDIHVASI